MKLNKSLQPNELTIGCFDDEQTYTVRAYGQWAKVITKTFPKLLSKPVDDGIVAFVTPVEVIQILGKVHGLTGYKSVKTRAKRATKA